MPLRLTDRRLAVEQQLFDVHVRIQRARVEYERADAKFVAASEFVRQAEEKMMVSETAVAHLECCEARRQMRAVAATKDRAFAVVAELELAQDDLLAKLVV